MKRPFKVDRPDGSGQSFSRLDTAISHAEYAMEQRLRRGLPDRVSVLDRQRGGRWERKFNGTWAFTADGGAS